MDRLDSKRVGSLLHLPAITNAGRRLSHLAGSSVNLCQMGADASKHFVLRVVGSQAAVALRKVLGLVDFQSAKLRMPSTSAIKSGVKP